MAQQIEPKELKEGDLILDLRCPTEYEAAHLGLGHIWIPLEQLNPVQFLKENLVLKETPLYLLCRSGNRAEQAAEQFEHAGHPNVFVIRGGILNAINQRLNVIS